MSDFFVIRWINAIRYPQPSFDDCFEAWEYFAENACFSRVEKLLQKHIDDTSSINKQTILLTLLKRMAKGNWPRFSRKFIKKNKDLIFSVSSYDSVKSIHYNRDKPSYLVDMGGRMLGIIVNKHTIIRGIVDYQIDKSMAEYLKVWHLLPDGTKMMSVGENLECVNQLLNQIGEFDLEESYWFKSSASSFIWSYPNFSKRPERQGKACFMAFM